MLVRPKSQDGRLAAAGSASGARRRDGHGRRRGPQRGGRHRRGGPELHGAGRPPTACWRSCRVASASTAIWCSAIWVSGRATSGGDVVVPPPGGVGFKHDPAAGVFGGGVAVQPTGGIASGPLGFDEAVPGVRQVGDGLPNLSASIGRRLRCRDHRGAARLMSMAQACAPYRAMPTGRFALGAPPPRTK